MPPGTPEAIAAEKAVAAAKTEIREVDKRLYTITPDGKGGQVATLIPGQPAAGEANPYGEGAEAAQLNYVDKLLLKGLKNATPEEQRHFETMVHQLWGSKVTVAADGTVVVVEGDPPPGVPLAGEAFKSGTLATPAAPGAGDGTATAPATGPGSLATVPPDLVAPGTEAPPAAPAPAVAPGTASPDAAAAGTAKRDAAGNLVNADGTPAYGGYLVEGQPPPAPVEQTVAGKTISTLKPAERTKEADYQVDKQVGYTRQALEPAAYFLNLKKGDLKLSAFQDVMSKMAEGTPVQNFISRYAMSADEREYFRNVIEIVKDMSHKDSGADVTKADLMTYRGLYELPLEPTEKDLAMLRRSIRNTLLAAREGFNGAVPAEKLRAWDADAGRRGIDLRVQEEIPAVTNPATTETAPAKARRWNDKTRKWEDVAGG